MKKAIFLSFFIAFFSCKKEKPQANNNTSNYSVEYRADFNSSAINGSVEFKDENGIIQKEVIQGFSPYNYPMSVKSGFEMNIKAAGVSSYSTSGTIYYTDVDIEIYQNGNMVSQQSGYAWQELTYIVK